MNKGLMSQIIESDGKCFLTIKVTPNQRKAQIICSNEIEAFVKSKPILNRANEELITLVKKTFLTDDVVIVRGHSSRKKRVQIGLSKNEIISYLSRL